MTQSTRSINWLESTGHSIQASCPETTGCSLYVTERLSALFLERIPDALGRRLLELLPPGASRALRPSGEESGDAAIGYTDFIERSRHAVAFARPSGRARTESELDLLSRRVADAFLWAVALELPPDLKEMLDDCLPSELRSRMNLRTAISDEARVA